VNATDAGRAVFNDVGTARRAHVERLLDRLDDAELDGFLIGLRGIKRARTELEAEAAG